MVTHIRSGAAQSSIHVQTVRRIQRPQFASGALHYRVRCIAELVDQQPTASSG